MCDLKPVIQDLIGLACVPRHMVGSPSHGALKYVVTECDLTIVKRGVRVSMGEKINKFGIKLRHGGHWTEWEFSHATCLAQFHRLDSFGIHHGRYVQEYYVYRDSLSDGMIPDHVEWVGDPQVMQDALTYLNMVAD